MEETAAPDITLVRPRGPSWHVPDHAHTEGARCTRIVSRCRLGVTCYAATENRPRREGRTLTHIPAFDLPSCRCYHLAPAARTLRERMNNPDGRLREPGIAVWVSDQDTEGLAGDAKFQEVQLGSSLRQRR